jgi:hypothetical protein
MLSARRYHIYSGTFGKARRGSSLLLALVLANVVATAAAQEYLTLPIDETARSHRAVAQQCLRDPAAYAANKAKFDDYFVKYHFPAMTRTEPDKIGEVGKLREEIFKLFLWKTTNAGLQSDLSNLAFIEMGKIVSAQNPPCHPAARYNAILIIGLLDDQYSPPKPYAKATKALTGVVDSATTNNRFPPAVILGALIGLERHAQLRDSLAPEAVSAMQAALLKLATHDEPIQEMDRNAYAWMRLRAASALARLGTVGDKNAVHDAIVKLAVSNKSLDDRCAAVALLDRLEYKDVKLDDAGTAEPMFALARDIAAAEDKRAQDFQDRGATGGGAFPGPGGFGPGGGAVFDPNAYPRRHVLARLTDLRTGLTKVKPALPAETQTKVDALLAAINPVIASASSKDTVDLRLAESIRSMAEAVNKAVPGAAKPEADKAKENAVF